MSAINAEEIRQEFLKSKIGLVGITILAILIIVSIGVIIIIPIDTFQQWNNPSYWLSFPKTAVLFGSICFLLKKFQNIR